MKTRVKILTPTHITRLASFNSVSVVSELGGLLGLTRVHQNTRLKHQVQGESLLESKLQEESDTRWHITPSLALDNDW